MKKLILIALVLTAFFAEAQLPIIITSANMPVTGDSARLSLTNVVSLMNPSNTNYTLTGANFMWTFDSLKTNSQMVRQFLPSAVTPYFFYFFFPKYGEKVQDSIPNLPAIPLGTVSLTIKNIWSFYKKISFTKTLCTGEGHR